MVACEALICFGPSLLYALAGIVLLPHQLIVAIGHGVDESWFPVLYFAGMPCFLLGVWQLVKRTRNTRAQLMPAKRTLLLIVVGIPAVLIGPVGMFALSEFELMRGWLLVAFLVLPLFGLVHFLFMAREYVFSVAQQAVAADRPKTGAG